MLPGERQPSDEAVEEVLPSIPNNLPVARWPGQLELGGIAVYVLDDGRRIISRTGATNFLTKWKGGVNHRPKYWGKLVMELIYEYLDPDVAQWLRENAPEPIHGQNYHQWLSEQYGLRRLIEHIWKVIGVASTCETMEELRYRMEQLYGKKPGFQFELKLVTNGLA
jgi:hypothetical protein